jgi:ABC-2 type transport system permease protein
VSRAPATTHDTEAGPRVGLGAAMRAETVKLTTSLPLRYGLAGAVALVAVLASLYAFFSREIVAEDGTPIGLGDPDVLLNVYTVGYSTGFIVALLFGTWLLAGEARSGVLAGTLLAVPRRGVVVAAKLVVAVVGGALLGLLLLGVTVAIGAGFAAGRGFPTRLADPDVLATIGACLAAFVPWTVLGLGLGALIGRQLVAVVVALVWVLLIEVLLAGLLSTTSATATLASYLPRSLSSALSGQALGDGIDAVGPLTALSLLAAYGGVLYAAGAAAVVRRDVRA